MIKLGVDVSDLLKFASRLEKVPAQTNAAIVRALNETGDGITRELIDDLTQETGLPQERIRSLVHSDRATRGRLEYGVTVRNMDLERETLTRPMPGRAFPTRDTNEFNEGKLVNVVTAGDDKVCIKCEEIAENGPYTIEQVRSDPRYKIKHHPHCRCIVIPYVQRRRLPVQEGEPFSQQQTARSEKIKVTLGQLADRLMKEAAGQLKLKVLK